MPTFEDTNPSIASVPPEEGKPSAAAAKPPLEVGGRAGPDPTRFGDWELRGRCIDF